MSSTINQKQRFWKKVEATLRSILVGGGADCTTALTAEDAASWTKTIILNALIIQDLLPDGSRLRSDGSLKQWCITIAKANILDVAKALKEYQLFIRNYGDEWCFISYDDFKHRLPYGFTGAYFAPVRDIIVSYLREPHTADFRVLNQWISFPLKLTLQGLASDLSQKSEEDFLINEERLAHLVFNNDDCEAVARVLKSWFRGLTQAPDFAPSHSNGAVANRDTKKGLYGKYCNMQSDHKIRYLYRKLGIIPSEVGFGRFHGKTVPALKPIAKLITVPKGIDKRRLICPEPAEYQFNQQAVWKILDNFIVHHPILSRHISIHDQSVNQQAALEASRYQDSATIDLSNASDSVSWVLVKRVFHRTPFLLQCMWATRSTGVRFPDKSVVTTNKYAPMGSALCFPIESILFAAICQVADDRTKIGRTRDSYHVYGDDIIVPTHAYNETIRLLTEFGFQVNEQKTYYPYSRFKESCGVEGFDGDDVSPIGISRKFSGIPLDLDHPKLVACYISLVNQLWSHGYTLARNYILADILSMPHGTVPPFSTDPRYGIASPCATNWNADRRYNSVLQEDEILVGCVTASKDPDCFRASDEFIRAKFGAWYFEVKYLETLRRYHETKRSSLFWPDDLIQVSLCKSNLAIRARWCPVWWFASPIDAVAPENDQEFITYLSLFVDRG